MPITPTERRAIAAVVAEVKTPHVTRKYYVIKQRSRKCPNSDHKAGFVTSNVDNTCWYCKWLPATSQHDANLKARAAIDAAREYAERMNLAASKNVDTDTATDERVTALVEHALFEQDNVATYVQTKDRVTTSPLYGSKDDYQDYRTNREASLKDRASFRVDGNDGFLEEQVALYLRPLNLYWIGYWASTFLTVTDAYDGSEYRIATTYCECKYCGEQMYAGDYQGDEDFRNEWLVTRAAAHYYSCRRINFFRQRDVAVNRLGTQKWECEPIVDYDTDPEGVLLGVRIYGRTA